MNQLRSGVKRFLFQRNDMYVFKKTPGGNELISSVNGNNVTVTVETSDADLFELLAAFEDFLRGSGFVFDGSVEIVQRVEDEN